MPSYPGGLRFERVVVPTPYAVGPANVYVFPDDPVTLFDCGPNTAAARNALRLGMDQAGVRPEQVARVVVSHGHPDHYGLAGAIRDLSGATVLAGELDVPKMMDASVLSGTGRLLLQAGMPMDTLAEMGERERRTGPAPTRIAGVLGLSDGDSVEFGRFELEVLHLPGHTAGHICLLHRDSGVLFSGDTLLLHVTPNPLLEPDPGDPGERRRSLVEYLATLDRLRDTALSRVYPGHGEPIDDPHALIERMRRHHGERTEGVAALLEAESKSGWELATELFPALEGFDNFLAVSEVLAHIDLLVAAGRAEAVRRGGVTYYRRPAGT